MNFFVFMCRISRIILDFTLQSIYCNKKKRKNWMMISKIFFLETNIESAFVSIYFDKLIKFFERKISYKIQYRISLMY